MTSPPEADYAEILNSGDVQEVFRSLVFERLNLDAGQGRLSQEQKEEVIKGFSRLEEKDVIDLGHKDSVCPICLSSLLALLAEEETAVAMDSPAHPVEELGVIRLSQPWQCRHIFCRRDISKWVLEGHDSCPTCRRRLVNTTNESSLHSDPDPDPLLSHDAFPESFIGEWRTLRSQIERAPDGAHIDEFTPNTIFTSQSYSRPNDLSNEYSAMYS